MTDHLDLDQIGESPVLPDTSDVCGFCQSYCPPETPAQQLDVAINKVDLLRADINVVLRELPVDAPLFAAADVVTALCHLRQASVLLDKAGATLEADATAVIR